MPIRWSSVPLIGKLGKPEMKVKIKWTFTHFYRWVLMAPSRGPFIKVLAGDYSMLFCWLISFTSKGKLFSGI